MTGTLEPHLSRRQVLAGLGSGSTVGVAGCAGGRTAVGGQVDGTVPTEPSGTYHAASASSFTTLNPLYNSSANEETAIGWALDYGYTFTDDGEYFPLLYDLWADDDAEVWVFELRDGLEFSEPYGQVTAESFVYQIRKLHQSEWAATESGGDWDGIEVYETGTLEFQAELPHPDPLWPESLGPREYPIPIELIEPYVERQDVTGLRGDERLLELQFTGNLGPYVLESWDRGAGTRYTRNDDYYLRDIEEGPDTFDDAPYFEEAAIRVIEEEASRLGALETWEVDNAEIPPTRITEFERKDDVDVYSIDQPYNQILSVNMRDNGWNAGPGNLFRVPEFRQAIACAIDKEVIVEGIYRGTAEPHFTWQPEWSDWYPDGDIPRYGVGDLYGRSVAQDKLKRALEQVDAAYGYDGEEFVNPDGEQVVLELYWTDVSATSEVLAEFIASECNENVGIEVDLQTIDATRFAEQYWTAEPEGGTDIIDGEEVEWTEPTPTNPGPRSVTSEQPWDMSIIYGLNTYPMYPLTNDAFFDGPTAQYNPIGYYPKFDAEKLWNDARTARDEAKLNEVFGEFFRAIADEQPYIMLAFPDSNEGYVAGLEGPVENSFNGWDFPAWYYPE